jgi:D-alanyl-lipoteichoic acid acyltransferase DltB (MBOAT superfamily)
VAVPVVVSLTRAFAGGDWFAPTRPPAVTTALPGLLGAAVLLLGLAVALRRRAAPSALLGAAALVLIALLVALKAPALSLGAAQALREFSGQNPALATSVDIRWLGFSYIAFRLLHLLRDRQSGRLLEAGLREVVSYTVFFPAIPAGPIDRLERFLPDFRAPYSVAGDPRRAEDLEEAGRRLALGLFKKFALADSLGLIALSAQNVMQVQGAGWTWLLLYAYALQIYLDFSGYTDIAIGLGRIMGVRLPENFAAPYRKPNLTQFWNSWHITLTMWFRAYYFNPLVRWLRGKGIGRRQALVLLIAQVTTMALIGLWHGIGFGFLAWGLWHGVGLFLQNRWTEFARARLRPRIAQGPAWVERGLGGLSTLLTFHFVAVGWVFFLLPDAPRIALALGKLMGGG